MRPDTWLQRTIEFRDWQQAETTAVEQLRPLLSAELGDTPWWFIRKHPSWRIRFRLRDPASARNVDRALDALVVSNAIRSWTPNIYEPETTAFGGEAAMDAAHDLFSDDSRHLLDHLARHQAGNTTLGSRELAVLLISVALRGAGLDWFEQGDVWAKAEALRAAPGESEPPARLKNAVRRLMTVDVSAGSPLAEGSLALLTGWFAAFERLGQRLADLHRTGRLERGLRAVLAHHAIFHFNRLGLPSHEQHILCTLAKEAVMESTESTRADQLRNELIDALVRDDVVRTPEIEEAMRTVPRHLFVPDAPLEAAYRNAPVNTKYDESGASISCASQPDIVAMMLEQMDVAPGQNILEAGAGTGFNAGLLGYLTGPQGHVTTIDVDKDIVEGARAGLAAAGIGNVEVILGDGAVGHDKNAPYDRIVATVGAHGVPHAWLDQLAPGGRLLTPIRLRGSVSRSIAFEHRHGAWRSVGSEMNTFMPLRRGIADDPRRFVNLTDDGSVTLVTNGDQSVDADALTGVLDHPRAEAWSGVTFRGPESAEWLELWLTCAMPNGLSRMPVTDAGYDSGLVTNPYPSSTAVFEGGTLTYLSRRLAVEKTPDGANLYEFGVIGHGPDAEALAGRVAEQIQIWDRDFRDKEVEFEIQPLDAAPMLPRPGRFVFDNALNRMVIEWQ